MARENTDMASGTPQVGKVDFRLHDWIDRKYRVERVLGHGDYDSKFKVVDREGRQYMLRVLNLWQMDSGRRGLAGARMASEIAGCSIDSPYLSGIAGSGFVKGNPYLLTTYYASTDLSRARDKGDVAKVMRDVLSGLGDLHRNGKVHGNLTAENVLKTDDGRILLTNYVALGERNRVVSDYRRNPGRLSPGALAFVAPERFEEARFATLLPTADIYSAGVLAYYLLTGRYPFGAMSSGDAYIQRSAGGRWNKSVAGRENAGWVEFLDRALSPDPSARPQSAEEAIRLIPGYEAEGPEPEVETRQQGRRNGLLLRLMQGEEFGRIYRLGELFAGGAKGVLTLGRESGDVFNRIEIKESETRYVSRRHSTVELDTATGRVFIRDGQWDRDATPEWASSLNGTYVNSTRVTAEGMELKPGDIVSVGDVKLRVEEY